MKKNYKTVRMFLHFVFVCYTNSVEPVFPAKGKK